MTNIAFRFHENILFFFIPGTHNGFLLGDSGYPCRSFLLTPLLQTATEAERKYNIAHCRTRVIIEQTFGIIKRRFQVLHEIRANPQQAVQYIIACVVLHNIGILRGDILDLDLDADNMPRQNARQVDDQPDGAAMRRHIIATYFT